MAQCTRPFASLKPIEKDLDLVAHKAGNNWRSLLTNLGIELADIEFFKDGRETKDACFKGLVHWLKGNVPDEPVTFGTLFQALKDSAMTGCISLLEEKLEARSRHKSADQDLSTQTNSVTVKASSEVQDAVKLKQVQKELEELKFEKESGHVKAKEQGAAELHCANCNTPIAAKTHIFSMSADGPRALHTNPLGYVHDTLTVTTAKNIVLQGRPSSWNSYFPPYAWTIVNCRICHCQLGWRFDDAGKKPSQFFGLTMANLKVVS